MSRTDTRSARSTALRRYAETHHVDQIRPEARYGGPWGQFVFWLGGNFNVFNVVLGAVVVEIGLAFWWALIAIGAGTVIGAVLLSRSRFLLTRNGQRPRLFWAWVYR